MHWTALLARRHLAPHVQVVDDLPCNGCGYNLRGLLASGACPECAVAVADSLYRLKHPDATAAALRTVGRSFTAPAVLLLAPLVATSLGVAWLILGGLAAGSVWRVIALTELRLRCGLERLPVLGTRITLALLAAVAGTVVAVATLVLFYLTLTVRPANPALEAAFGWTLAGWLAVLAIDAIVAGRFGAALAGLLDWDFIAREFGRQVLCVVLGGVALLLFVLAAVTVSAFGGPLTASTILVRIGAGGLVLFAAGAVLFTVLGFLHLAGAAERDRDAREDVLEAATQVPPPPAPAPRESLPEIPLERDPRHRGT